MSVRSDIRDQYHAELANWTRNVSVTRFISTTDETGRESGGFVSQTNSEPMWIQPLSKGTEEVEIRGLAAETTHLGFQRWDGFQLEPQDKIIDVDESGQTRNYDVVRAHLKESHRVAELMEVKRDTN
ncbi:MAG: hypothetical protein ACWGQW_08825 [bacterium]